MRHLHNIYFCFPQPGEDGQEDEEGEEGQGRGGEGRTTRSLLSLGMTSGLAGEGEGASVGELEMAAWLQQVLLHSLSVLLHSTLSVLLHSNPSPTLVSTLLLQVWFRHVPQPNFLLADSFLVHTAQTTQKLLLQVTHLLLHLLLMS